MENVSDCQDKKKPHRERLAGRKAKKKKDKNKHIQELTAEQRNPKAFAINSAIRAERKFRRTQDLKSKKEHIPVVDRTPIEPPPILVAIVGPPKVGKSTLIRCMIKSYSNQPLSTIKGPVTVVSGKKRRITFIECNSDINSMVDIAKVADLVLLMIDGSFGFEMEIFEFLNICQVHGMPKIMGVLTHLDMIKQTKRLQRTKKTLKRRFWTEVYAGAKLFYLSGLLHNEFLRKEVKNLCRFISVMKFRPLVWQTTHSYILADRIEDITPPEDIRNNPKVDRKVCLYGYVRGIPLNKKSFIHIPGCGDFPVADMCFLPDPCPLPEQLKKRALVDKERLLYAPFSGVGGIVYDKDAVYIELSHIPEKKDKEMKEMLDTLIESKDTLDDKLAKSGLQLFSNSAPIINEEFENLPVKDDKDCIKEYKVETIINSEDGRKRRKVIFDEGDSGVSESDRGESSVEKFSSDNDEECSSHPASTKSSKRKSTVIHESSSDEEENVKREKVLKNRKNKRKGEKINSNDDCDVNLQKNNESSDLKDTSEQIKYKGVQSDKDKEIKNVISSVLSELESGQGDFSNLRADSESSSDDNDLSEEGDVDVGAVPWEKNNLNEYDNDGSDEDDEDDGSGDSDVESSEESDFTPENTDVKWKENLARKAADEYLERQASKQSLWKLVYGEENEVKLEDDNGSGEEEIGGLFKVVSEKQQNILKSKDTMNGIDCSIAPSTGVIRDWSLSEVRETIKDCFVTGKWKMDEDAKELLKLDDLSDEEEDIFGDFEDLETGQKFVSSKDDQGKTKAKKIIADTNDKNDEDQLTKEQLLERKKKLKEKFDLAYDTKDEETYFDELKNEANRQAELNRSQFEGLDDRIRVELEGFRSGLYVRLEITETPCELIENFDPTYPLIIGGLQPQEQNIGYVKVRIKKHRWYSKILKSRDPLIISVGWRRFQTVAVYSKQEDNMRHRMLKYTPEHVACMGHFWGPMMRSGTGFLALKNAGSTQPEAGFRIVATGTILDSNQSTVVTKKLKLTGEPFKIFKKTAFIKGMFNSSLEVAKFEGAKIKTVSGIRGQIKKMINDPPGAFRATFEDKILLSDIVFCRTWYQVDIPKFYAPVTSLLLADRYRRVWEGMKTLGQLKREHGIQNPSQPDSMYTEIHRPLRKFRELIIPRSIQKNLPFKYKIKEPQKVRNAKPGAAYKRSVKKVVVRDDHEAKVANMLLKLRVCYRDKKNIHKQQKHQKMLEFIQRKKEEEFKKNQKHKQIKKKIFRALSKTSEKPSAV